MSLLLLKLQSGLTEHFWQYLATPIMKKFLEDGSMRIVMKLPPVIAPFKVAVLP